MKPQHAKTVGRIGRVVSAAALLTAVLLSVRGQGCGRASQGYQRYVPDEAAAREALAAVLAAWKASSQPDEIVVTGQARTMRLVDTRQRAGQRLLDYEILGEVSAEGPRSFEVRLHLDNPKRDERLLYYLVGIDPLWVFRQEDYNMVAHWDHPMADTSSETTQKPVTAPPDGPADASPSKQLNP
ncbi:MAG: hypothetical protein WD278_03770 [Pirellulales bacterium]